MSVPLLTDEQRTCVTFTEKLLDVAVPVVMADSTTGALEVKPVLT